MPTLLEKALTTPRRRPRKAAFTDEHIELIFAYLNDKITIRQSSIAIGGNSPGSFTHWFGAAITTLYREGKIKIERNA